MQCSGVSLDIFQDEGCEPRSSYATQRSNASTKDLSYLVREDSGEVKPYRERND